MKSFKLTKSLVAVERMLPHSLIVLGTIEQKKVFSEILTNIKK